MSAPYTDSPARADQRPHGWPPAQASDNRLALAAMTDGFLALLIGIALAQRVFHATDGVAAFLATFIPCVLAASFVNHVFGTLLFRGSVAKLLFGMRVLRWKDGRRPRFWQTLGRWLFGFVVIVFSVRPGRRERGAGLRSAHRTQTRREGCGAAMMAGLDNHGCGGRRTHELNLHSSPGCGFRGQRRTK
ncbi:RDD family protein [Nocardia suismassiliense]|uniref:RDD family protein n=1 Tax=Nocardia suismassiliense TaxID=2077092 RepID=A0ABW6QPE2_9NOCA